MQHHENTANTISVKIKWNIKQNRIKTVKIRYSGHKFCDTKMQIGPKNDNPLEAEQNKSPYFQAMAVHKNQRQYRWQHAHSIMIIISKLINTIIHFIKSIEARNESSQKKRKKKEPKNSQS